MKKKCIALLSTILISVSSCVQNQDVKSKTALFNEAQLLEHVKTLSFDMYQGRATGSAGGRLAQNYIIKNFEDLGVQPFRNYKHDFDVKRNESTITGTNILGLVNGTTYKDKYIVISAHYDHLGIGKNGQIYNGADDNASGVAALFTFAQYLKDNPPKHSIILAAFDAEEIGLQGSKHFVRTIKEENVLLNINMDMISRSPKNELYVVGGRYHKPLEEIIERFENPTSTKLLVGHDGTDGKVDWTLSSDHSPFHEHGIPFLYFGNEDHSDYHTPSDDFENITPQFYINAVEIILSILLEIDEKGV
ncbi:M20/M25/M40 family metallo-hydrolase [Winogradskyella sp.]|uniref:M20/M25/M40 family metallo-hydrolase n=1 Tax=Winogradskyella sp. TaxID=1883156 RepID=UPI003BAAA69F